MRPWEAEYVLAYDAKVGFLAVPTTSNSQNLLAPIWTSTDGVKFDFVVNSPRLGSYLVAANGIFLSTGSTNAIYSSSNGGLSWASIPVDPTPWVNANRPSVINGQFWVPTTTKILTSPNGISWTTLVGTRRVQTISLSAVSLIPLIFQTFRMLHSQGSWAP